MAKLIGDKSDIQFSGINQPQLVINTKITAAPYEVNNSGVITNNLNVLNAIDIDWNNVISNEIITPIKTTTDLISIISENKGNIRINTNAIEDLQSQVNELSDAIDNLGGDDNSGLSQEIQSIKNQLIAISDNISDLESSQGNMADSLISLANTINQLNQTVSNLRIPRYVQDLQDGNDVLRISSFSAIKNELKGDSAFDIAKRLAEENGESFPYYTEADWIASLKGATGRPGQSAYELAKQTAQLLGNPFPYANEQEWILSISSGSAAIEYTDEKMEEIMSVINSSKLEAGDGIYIENNKINASVNTWINL